MTPSPISPTRKAAIIVVALIVACQPFVTDRSMAQQEDGDLYPDLPMAREYRHVAHLMTGVLVEKAPEFLEHKDRILSFIFSRMSVNSFERQMADACSADRQDLAACEYVTTMMAVMVVSHSHDVYMRKVLKPDALTAPMFAVSDDPEADLIISWIEREVSASKFRKGSRSSFVPQPGDRIFSYRSPPFSWRNKFGRAGFAVFRGGKLVENALGMMN